MKQELRSAIRSILATQHLAMLGSTMALAATVSVSADAAELPMTCASGSCGAWVTSGSATEVRTNTTLTINQTSDRAVLNWASFNVSADGRVVFNQPNANSIALNRIYDINPSRIFGTVEANGQIYLVNPNGFVFGRTAKINAAGILASTLNISDQTFASGLLAPELIQNQLPALASDGRVYGTDEHGNVFEVKLVVEEGATLASRGEGGRVMLASREIDNAGNISSPDGQVILAAGDKVYLQASTDPGLRGLLVEVAAGGEAWNRMTGTISADRGNVTVAGLAVNQSGRVSASTTVEKNGSVRLLARDNPMFITDGDKTRLGAGQNGGRLELGATSRIEVLPDLTDKGTAVDDQKQLASNIELTGREVFMRSGSKIVAPAGELEVTAAGNINDDAYDPTAKLRVEAGTLIDLSGSDVTLPMSRNLVTVELRANEMRDSPYQRDGALRGQTVVVDARIGTRIADVSGALAGIPKNIAERTSTGGTAMFNSQGDVVVADGARVDVSGGAITYEQGPVATSLLIGADGKLYDIGEADPTRTYVGVLNPTFRRADDRWGYVDTIAAPGIPRMAPSYVWGSNAGTVQFAAPSMVMNGTLQADTVIGPYQREPGKAPLGGQLIIGLPDGLTDDAVEDYRAPSVTFSNVDATIGVGDDAPLPAQQTLLLPTEYLSRGFTRTAVYSNGRITVAEDTPLNLADGSTLQLTGQQVDILSDITATGGTIKATSILTAGTGETLGRAGVTVGEGVTLDVQGNWVNDALTARTDPFGRPTSSIYSDGGSIALAVRADGGELVLGDQVSLLANAGGWLQSDGSLSGGDGGSIELNGGAFQGVLEIGAGLNVQAFGMLGAQGGKFSLTAPRIEVKNGASWSSAQRVDADPTDPESDLDYLGIGTALFTDHGFRSVSLSASGPVDSDTDPDALRIGSGTEIRARTSVLQMNGDLTEVAAARNLEGLASVALPDESERGPMSLAFAASPANVGAARLGRVNIAEGASILTDAGSSVQFSSVGGIKMDGIVRARGGSIGMTVTTPIEADDVGYRDDIGIHLGATSLLDVSGTAVYEPIGNGVLQGSLYDGGSVTLQANRGVVVVEQGAVIDVSGTSAAFDRNVTTGEGLKRQMLASDAGVLTLIAPEAIAFSGDFRAHAGVGDSGTATGGELVMRLSRQRGFAAGSPVVQPTYPTDPRVLRVTSQDIVLGGPTPPNGLAVLSQDVIENSGIDALTLEADGRIEFDDTSLSLGRRIVVDSPEIVARDGADVSLSAEYVSIGNSIASRQAVTPTTGTGTFTFQGNFLEAIGAVSLSGAATTTFASTSDIRLRQSQTGTTLAGHLQTSGDLTLRATQIYPSTLSSYALTAQGDDATLRIESSGTASPTPLTAGGKLTLTAANIEQHGRLLAPFGSIDLNASDSLVLGSGSTTSVSGNGALIPFGRVENGEWLYQLGGSQLSQTAIPERRIGLNAPSIEQDANATLDLRGGGDLYAYEWIPGTGGSQDALAGNNADAAGRYAIIPSQRGQFAPYDPQEMASAGLEVGDSVYLSGIPGLEPGFYALLPARYALLPGALLIEAVPSATDIPLGTVTSLADGTPVVAGYRTFGSTGLGSTQYSGFAIRLGAQARNLATYQDSLASTYYKQRAERLELPAPVLPADAGTLSLLATTSLDMQGIVNVSAAQGGRAGRVEIAAANLEVVATPSDSTDSVQIAASVLNSWRPGELWIGGTVRNGTVDVIAEQVRIGAGANLSAGEVVMVANDRVDVAAGATVASTSGTNGTTIDSDTLADVTLQLNGTDSGAAVLAVSDRNRYTLARVTGDIDNDGDIDADDVDVDVGSVTAAAGSVLATGGYLLGDSPSSLALNGDFRARGAEWQLGSSHVRFDEAAHADGLNIDAAFLARLQEAGSLTITSGGAMDFAYGLNLGTVNPIEPRYSLESLTLQAASFNNLTGQNVGLAASTVNLLGTATAPTGPTTAGNGLFSIEGHDVNLGAGNFDITGFARTALTAENDIRGIGKTNVRIGGDLDMTAARVTAASGGHTFINAQGAVRIARGGDTPSTSIDGVLGGALSISANEIDHTGTLFLPSGLVTLDATSRLSVGSTGVIDVSGQMVRAADRIVGTSGGTVRLASGGTLDTASDSEIDVSAASGADAGRLYLHANDAATLAGSLRGASGGASQIGGAFNLYAGSLANASSLVAQLQSGGFTEQQSIHVRSGDLNLDDEAKVTARVIEWTTDQGSIRIDGTMRAASTGQRSAIRLNGGNGVTLDVGGRLDADGVGDARFGGDIEIGSTAGQISLLGGSTVTANGAELDGSLRLRAAAAGNDVAITQLASTIQNVNDLVVEPVRVFDVSGAPTAADLDAIRVDTQAYVLASASIIRNRLDPLNTRGLRIEAGVELRHDGDLQLGALNLANWRFDDDNNPVTLGSPVALTVRSTGSIGVNGTISDGFGTSGVGANARTTLLGGKSATLRFAAGADLASADPNAVVRNALADFTLGTNALVRTGTGDIYVTAARDVVFNTGSSIYTGGIAAEPAQNLTVPTAASFNYPDQGGNVSIVAGRDVRGMAVTQSVTEWQRRQGTDDDATLVRRTQWGTDLRRFGWNTGTLGGGDLSIVAGNDVIDLSAAAADSAVERTEDQLTRFGGGALSVTAGGDVNTAMLYVARGEGRVLADGELGSSRTSALGDEVGTLIMMGDAQVNVSARGNINLESPFNPTALMQQGIAPAQRSLFFTYGDQSALDVRSRGGNVSLTAGDTTRLYDFIGQAVASSNTGPLSILPSSLTLMSQAGDVQLKGMMTLFPSDHGQLNLFAARDITAAQGTVITMSDVAAGQVATPLAPVDGGDFAYLAQSAASARHANDMAPALVTAGRDIVAPIVQVAKSVKVSAGRDIIDTTLRAQNLRSTDVTSVTAGRDLSFAPTLLTGQMSVGGPGRFDVLTGRNLDLGFSGGLTTTGRLQNAAIQSETGADLNVMVGMGREIDANAFVDKVIGESAELQKQLIAFMKERTGTEQTYDNAAAAFKALDSSAQRPLLLDMFYAELVASGREYNLDAEKYGFKRGYSAIDALFPGSRAKGDEVNPFEGDLTLAFSRIYTLAGGDISIAVPGGLVNVGLANPPPTIQQRPASELGIVAQRSGSVRMFTNDDVLVNQSRVFTLLGGDIAIWSTVGDIDAGRGAKSSVSAPPPAVLVDSTGRVTLDFAGAVAGSGIRTITTAEGVIGGDVDLIAPEGTVNAGDGGIESGRNINIAAENVLGVDNIQFAGASAGVPSETSGVGLSLAGVSAVASSSSSASTSVAQENDESDEAQQSLAQTALSWLEVFVVGLGEENCKQDDVDCLKRQPLN